MAKIESYITVAFKGTETVQQNLFITTGEKDEFVQPTVHTKVCKRKVIEKNKTCHQIICKKVNERSFK